MGMKTQCCAIVKDWADIIIVRQGTLLPTTTLIMDSYYLSGIGREYMNSHGVQYVTALKSDRFRKICKIFALMCKQSGETAVAHNCITNETAVYQGFEFNPGSKILSHVCFILVCLTAFNQVTSCISHCNCMYMAMQPVLVNKCSNKPYIIIFIVLITEVILWGVQPKTEKHLYTPLQKYIFFFFFGIFFFFQRRLTELF